MRPLLLLILIRRGGGADRWAAPGKWDGEPTNEVFFARFRSWLAAQPVAKNDFDADVLPQIDRITVHTLLVRRGLPAAAWRRLASRPAC